MDLLGFVLLSLSQLKIKKLASVSACAFLSSFSALFTEGAFENKIMST